ncbi:nitroreductase [Nonomuraea sp. KC401]|uniref:nitroreductase family protein n=1 Tax=unclassified Nonomuraea TaxID=2593643 RepID=UPI0010FE6D62|nr:nitroreductase family protein [Nonomuraea sp. KC401]NBE96273.1 nitroreductase [Nonomuraea sp. K271]TLF70892.1 nitroreductase [Nonomuraea sp. KC401]
MDIFEALYTTRAMRRVKPDPVPDEVQRSILDAAVRAPSAGNEQRYRFVLVDDQAVKEQFAPLYRDALARLFAGPYKELARTAGEMDGRRFLTSARYLADNFETYPLLLFAFSTDTSGSSVFPAVWSAQLAARAHGVGSTLTTVLGIYHPTATMRILGVPKPEGWRPSCMVTFGYPTGRWDVAVRRPASQVSYRNRWGAGVGLDLDEPVWRPDA